jgi:hypothetical protein
MLDALSFAALAPFGFGSAVRSSLSLNLSSRPKILGLAMPLSNLSYFIA